MAFFPLDCVFRLFPTAADFEYSRGPASIKRTDRNRVVNVTSDVDAQRGNANEIIADTRRRFLPGFLERHPGVGFSVEGQDKEAGTTQRSMMRGLLLGLVGVFLLLSFQFRSYVEPLIVMLAIPLASIGVIWGHLAMGVEVSMPSILGFASLAGIVVNDSILLVSEVSSTGRKRSRLAWRAASITSATW